MITKKYDIRESAKCSLRFDGKCFACNDNDTLRHELDHNIAKSLNGANNNFTELCARCNKRKAKMSPEEFYGDAKVLAELDLRLSMEFTDDELFAEVARLCQLELDYVKRCKAIGVKVSTAVQRAMQMKNVKHRLTIS
jgi:hypothetical protein